MPRSMRAAVSSLLLVLLLACSASQDGRSGGGDDMGAGMSSVPGVVDDRSTTTRRFGEGRALSARSSPRLDRLVVQTTVGLAVHDPSDGSVGLIERNSVEVGHTALSPDGRFFAIIDGADPMLEVWSLTDGVRLFRAPVDQVPVVLHAVLFDQDNSKVTVSTSSSVASWSLDGVQTELLAAPVGETLGTAAVAGDGGRVVAAVIGAPTPRLVEWIAPGSVRTVELPIGSDVVVGATAFASDGLRVVLELGVPAEPTTSSLAVFDLTSGVLREAARGVGSLSAVQWALGSDNRVMIVEPTSVQVVDFEGAVLGRSDLANDDAPVSVFAPPDSDTFVTSHADGSLVVWGAAGERLTTLPPTVGALRDVAYQEGPHVVTVGYSGLVDSWEVPSGLSAGLIDRYAQGAVRSVAVSSAGDTIAVARSAGHVDLLDSETGELRSQLDHSGRNIDSVAFSPDASEVVTGVGERIDLQAFDDTVTVWDAATGESRYATGGEGESVAGCSSFRNLVRYSPDGELIAASSHDFTVTLSRADDLAPVLTLPPHGGTVLDLAFSRDGRTLATSSEDMTVRTWDASTGSMLGEHESTIGGYWAIAFAPDGKTLATVGSTGVVQLVGVADGRVVRSFDDAANWLSDVAFSNDGMFIAAGGKENDVILWRTYDGAVVDRLVGHADRVGSVAFSTDGTFLVSGSDDGTVRRWPLHA